MYEIRYVRQTFNAPFSLPSLAFFDLLKGPWAKAFPSLTVINPGTSASPPITGGDTEPLLIPAAPWNPCSKINPAGGLKGRAKSPGGLLVLWCDVSDRIVV